MATLTSCIGSSCLIKRAMSAGGSFVRRGLGGFLSPLPTLPSPPPQHQQQPFLLLSMSLMLCLLLCYYNSPHMGRKTKTLKNGLCPFCCSLYNSNNGGGRQKVLRAYSLHLCSWGGGEGKVRHGLCSFLSNHCYSPAATMARSFQHLFRWLSFPNCPGSASCSCKEEILLSCAGRDSAVAPQQATCALLQSGACVSGDVSLHSARVIDSCEQRCRNQPACVGPLYYLWS